MSFGLYKKIQTDYILNIIKSNKLLDYGLLSLNPHITWSIVSQNFDKPWNWYGLSNNPNITWDIIKENPDKPWDWSGISQNQNITCAIITDNLKKPWEWDATVDIFYLIVS